MKIFQAPRRNTPNALIALIRRTRKRF